MVKHLWTPPPQHTYTQGSAANHCKRSQGLDVGQTKSGVGMADQLGVNDCRENTSISARLSRSISSKSSAALFTSACKPRLFQAEGASLSSLLPPPSPIMRLLMSTQTPRCSLKLPIPPTPERMYPSHGVPTNARQTITLQMLVHNARKRVGRPPLSHTCLLLYSRLLRSSISLSFRSTSFLACSKLSGLHIPSLSVRHPHPAALHRLLAPADPTQ